MEPKLNDETMRMLKEWAIREQGEDVGNVLSPDAVIRMILKELNVSNKALDIRGKNRAKELKEAASKESTKLKDRKSIFSAIVNKLSNLQIR